MIRRRAAVWAAVALALIAGCIAVVFTGRAPIQTDLLALLPATERNPVVEQAVTGLAQSGAQRSVFLVGHSSPVRAKELARRVTQILSADTVFTQVRSEFPAPDVAAVRELYLPYRFQLLSHADRQTLTGNPDPDFVARQAQRRLYDPFRRGLGVPLEQDPLGLLDGYLSALAFTATDATLEFDNDGSLLARDDERTYVVLLAELNGSAYDGNLQQRLRSALADAQDAVREGGGVMLRTGTVHYAMAGRETAERELNVIASGSLLGIALMLFWAFRSLRPIALGLFSVLVGVCAATLATVAAFGEVHLITLVFGASLTGEAVDYSIQYFAARLDAGRKWSAERGLRAVLPGIVVALITSVLGYGALALTPFPALRQIALFAIVGLAAAGLTVVLLLPAWLQSATAYRPTALLRRTSDLLARCQRWGTVRARWAVIGALVLLAIPGWLRLTAEDDIRLLVNPPAELATQEQAIRRLTGFEQSGQFFVVEGESAQEVLEREERLTDRLRLLQQEGGIKRFQAVSDFVPSMARQQDNRRLWRERIFPTSGEWRRVLADLGFKPGVIARQAAALRQAPPTLQIDTWVQSPVSAPVRHLWLGATGNSQASIVMPSGFASVAVLEGAADGLPGVTLVDKAGAVSSLFREYRTLGALVLLVAAVLVFAVLGARYGWRQGLRGMLPTVMGIGVTLAAFGYAATPMTLFNGMALLLVLGVSVNYVIFLREGSERRGAALIGVLLSAATTILAFGLLAWSSTPALSQFGSTLFIGIAATVALAPIMDPVATGRAKKRAR